MKKIISWFYILQFVRCTPNLYLMELSADIDQVNANSFCTLTHAYLSNISVISHVYEQIDCQSSLPQTAPSSPPIICNTRLECQVPIHHTYRRKLHIDDAYGVECSVWLNKKCSSAAEFLRAHNCSNIEVCAGCCLIDSPPPQIPPPPPPMFTNTTFEMSTDYPPWVFAITLALVLSGLFLCTSVLLYGNCFLIANDVLNYLDLMIQATRQTHDLDPSKNAVSKNMVPDQKPVHKPAVRKPVVYHKNDTYTLVEKTLVRPPTRKNVWTVPNIWSRAPIVGETSQPDRADVVSEPMIRFSTKTEFEVRRPYRRSRSVPKSRTHIRNRF